LRKYFTISAFLILSACAMGPDYERPQTKAATLEKFINAPEDAEQETATMSKWWENIGDEKLNELVKILLTDNLDLKAAGERLIQANERVYAQQGAYFPTLGANSGVARSATSSDVYTTNYELGLATSWQVDLFGKIKEIVNSAQANYLASRAENEALIHSLIAALLQKRIEISANAKRLELAENIAKSRKNTLESVERRYRSGVASTSALEVRLARENLASAQATATGLKADLTDSSYDLDVLLGRAPGTTILEAADFPAIPRIRDFTIPPPLALLDRRPDLQTSELRLIAANADISVAIAELYPNLTFGGNIGTAGSKLSDLFSSGQIGWSLLGNIALKIFEGGKLRANIRISEARARELMHIYEKDVLNAVKEVESALQREDNTYLEVTKLEENVDEAKKAAELAENRYRQGIIPLLDLLDIQRRAQIAEQSLITAQQSLWNTRIALYLALGGDWEITPITSPLIGGIERGSPKIGGGSPKIDGDSPNKELSTSRKPNAE